MCSKDNNNFNIQQSLALLRQELGRPEYQSLTFPDDEDFLRPFLYTMKFDVKRSARMVNNFFGVKEKILGNMKLESKKYANILRKNFGNILRQRDKCGRVVFVIGLDEWNPEEHDFDEVSIRGYLMLIETMQLQDVQKFGITAIVDFSALKFAHLRELTYRRIRNFFTLIQNAMPIRVGEVHVVNNADFFNLIFGLARHFISEKLKKRIYFHGRDLASLESLISKPYLPKSLGGLANDNTAFDMELIERILQKDEYYKRLDTFGHCNRKHP